TLSEVLCDRHNLFPLYPLLDVSKGQMLTTCSALLSLLVASPIVCSSDYDFVSTENLLEKHCLKQLTLRQELPVTRIRLATDFVDKNESLLEIVALNCDCFCSGVEYDQFPK